MQNHFAHGALAALSLSLVACGSVSVYRPAATAGFELDAAQEINDEDVAKAFEAKPQLPEKFAVAYYSFDPDRVSDIDQMLRAHAAVEQTYRIPPLMVTGERRWESAHHYYQPPQPVSVKKLRLLAARAHADLLVIFDYGYRTGGSNGLASLNLLIAPIFFSPYLDQSAESYLESYVIDVRNGYLYAHIAADEQGGDDMATIYDQSADAYVAEQWPDLLRTTERELAWVVNAARAEAASAVAAAPPAEAVTPEPAPDSPDPDAAP